MKKFLLVAMLLLFPLQNPGRAEEPEPLQADSESTEMRQEFDRLFGDIRIYKAIRKYEPQSYEELFDSYVKAKQAGRAGEFKSTAFINRIRNSRLKTSSDESIFKFYRHIIQTGRNIYLKDPEAAFSYIFGGNPKAYSSYIDLSQEMDALGVIFENVLSTSSQRNMANVDKEEADNGLTLVFLDLQYKYGSKLSILESKNYAELTPAERACLCDMYLYMHEQIFNLESPTRDHVLRSFALKL